MSHTVHGEWGNRSQRTICLWDRISIFFYYSFALSTQIIAQYLSIRFKIFFSSWFSAHRGSSQCSHFRTNAFWSSEKIYVDSIAPNGTSGFTAKILQVSNENQFDKFDRSKCLEQTRFFDRTNKTWPRNANVNEQLDCVIKIGVRYTFIRRLSIYPCGTVHRHTDASRSNKQKEANTHAKQRATAARLRENRAQERNAEKSSYTHSHTTNRIIP